MELFVDREQLEYERPTDSARGNYCKMSSGVLVHPYDTRPPNALTTLVHESFRGLALNQRFSCQFSRNHARVPWVSRRMR